MIKLAIGFIVTELNFFAKVYGNLMLKINIIFHKNLCLEHDKQNRLESQKIPS